jgi:hypothetical protein
MSGAIIQISIAETPGYPDRVVLKATRTGGSLTLELPPGELENARGTVEDILRDFKREVGPSLGPPTKRVKDALGDLLMQTTLLGGNLADGPAGMQRLRDLFVEALPDWATHPEVPLVEVEGPSYGFPFELLPVFDLEYGGSIDDIETFARRFLGFSASVRRIPYMVTGKAGLPAGQVLRGRPLPLSFTWYARMDGPHTEHEFLARLADHVELNGPWPGPPITNQQALKALADGLVDPRRRYSGAQLGREVQIHHFACHCDTSPKNPAKYDLELAGDDGRPRHIRLAALNQAFINGPKLEEEPGRPLVFLNACGSAHQDPRAMYSWPKWFLQTRHCAVIGPETLVPDKTAAKYACFFYRALFKQRTVGEALVIARRDLLHEFGNPLGLLYVLYGDPAITVDEPIPQEVLCD